MNVSTKLIIAATAITSIILIWYYVVVQIFVSTGPGNGEISSRLIPYVIIAATTFIILNLVVEVVAIFTWFSKNMKAYILAIVVVITIFNLALTVIELNKYI